VDFAVLQRPTRAMSAVRIACDQLSCNAASQSQDSEVGSSSGMKTSYSCESESSHTKL
jgi:hypothetical protein